MSEPKEVKQVIVWRDDLKEANTGKKMAQAGHAALAALSNKIREQLMPAIPSHPSVTALVAIEITPEMASWILGIFKKVVVKVNSEEELLEIYQQAKDAGLTTELITDSGLTTFDGPTNTCVGIGPNYADEIDKITRKLPLLRD